MHTSPLTSRHPGCDRAVVSLLRIAWGYCPSRLLRPTLAPDRAHRLHDGE